jgi:hypothetical protein
LLKGRPHAEMQIPRAVRAVCVAPVLRVKPPVASAKIRTREGLIQGSREKRVPGSSSGGPGSERPQQTTSFSAGQLLRIPGASLCGEISGSSLPTTRLLQQLANVGNRCPFAKRGRELLKTERTRRCGCSRRRIARVSDTVSTTLAGIAARGRTLVAGIPRRRQAARGIEVAHRRPAAEIVGRTDRAWKTGFYHTVRARQVDIDRHHIRRQGEIHGAERSGADEIAIRQREAAARARAEACRR